MIRIVRRPDPSRPRGPEPSESAEAILTPSTSIGHAAPRSDRSAARQTASAAPAPSRHTSTPTSTRPRSLPSVSRASRAKCPWVTTIGSAQNPAEGGAQNTPVNPRA